jgi:phosphatidylinositol glycan class W
LVSRDARSAPSGGSGGGSSGGVRSAAARAAPLLLLGFLRLAATTSSGYVVPIGEYGAHWNFFFTLAAVALLGAAAPPPRRGGARAAAAACAAVLCLHALALHAGGLAAWLDAPSRGDDVLSQNREGIVSVVRAARAALLVCTIAFAYDAS